MFGDGIRVGNNQCTQFCGKAHDIVSRNVSDMDAVRLMAVLECGDERKNVAPFVEKIQEAREAMADVAQVVMVGDSKFRNGLFGLGGEFRCAAGKFDCSECDVANVRTRNVPQHTTTSHCVPQYATHTHAVPLHVFHARTHTHAHRTSVAGGVLVGETKKAWT